MDVKREMRGHLGLGRSVRSLCGYWPSFAIQLIILNVFCTGIPLSSPSSFMACRLFWMTFLLSYIHLTTCIRSRITAADTSILYVKNLRAYRMC